MPNRTVFLDTNGWLALLNSSDTLHLAADRIWRDLGRQGCSIVLTDWIIAETGNSLARSPGRDRFVRAVQGVLNSPRCRVVFVTASLLERALLLFEGREDKSWGLADCASFVVMGDAQITEGFTNDRHFEQAGFKNLLPIL
jgi:predicted nucleic acid-binding protein